MGHNIVIRNGSKNPVNDERSAGTPSAWRGESLRLATAEMTSGSCSR
jgi:hypothetical protein